MDFVDGYLAGLEAAIHKLSRQDVSAVVEALLVPGGPTARYLSLAMAAVRPLRRT